MTRLTCLAALGGFVLFSLPHKAQASECCRFESVSCSVGPREDPRCETGAKSRVSLNDVWGCPAASGIILDGDPILFGISYAIATQIASDYCENQSGDVCEPPSPDPCRDSDGDGLLDIWETDGLDGDADGTFETTLPGADPARLDLFLELDCMKSDGNGDGDYDDAADHSHCPSSDALLKVVKSFADAPRRNPDRTTGIQLHIDVGSLYGRGRVFTVAGTGGVVGSYGDFGGGGDIIDEGGRQFTDFQGSSSYENLKSRYFEAVRAKAFRYGIFAHELSPGCWSGRGEVGGNDLVVTLGGLRDGKKPCWGADVNGFSVGTPNDQASALMHEFGHTLGLKHGGGDDLNNKPNYLSVMNYNFTSCTVPRSPSGDPLAPGGCAYSAVDGSVLDECALDECAGIDAGELGFGAFDWNKDKKLQGPSCPIPGAAVWQELNDDDQCVGPGADSILQTPLASDDTAGSAGTILNGPNCICNSEATSDDAQTSAVGATEPPLAAFDDWGHLDFDFRTKSTFANGNHGPIIAEPRPEDVEAARREISERAHPDVNVEVTVAPTVLPGQTLSYAARLTSNGPGPALEALTLSIAPDGVETFTSLGSVLVGQSVDLPSAYVVPADACPMSLVRSVIVECRDLVGQAVSFSGVAASEVLDVVPPSLVLSGPPTLQLECGVDRYTENGATATDSCDPDVPVIIGGDRVLTDRPGTYRVHYSAQDDSGNVSSLDRSARVADTIAPSLSVSVNPVTLWPPNHKLVRIDPTITVSDACDQAPVVTLVGIDANEPVNGSGDGSTDTDIVIDPQGKIYLRAERSGRGNGRVYTFTYRAVDASNNARTARATVTVPKN